MKVAGIKKSGQQETGVQCQDTHYLKMLGNKRIRQEPLDGQ